MLDKLHMLTTITQLAYVILYLIERSYSRGRDLFWGLNATKYSVWGFQIQSD